MSMIQFVEEKETTRQTEGPAVSHIVDRGDSKKSAQALVLEAFMYGTELTALCGHKWIPSRDPKKFPVCDKCLEIFEFAKDMRGTQGPVDGVPT